MSHPARADILRLLRDHGALSPVRAAEHLPGRALSGVAYHFRQLEQLGG